MKVPRGFRAKCNRLAIGLRHQLGLPSHAPLSMTMLCKKLGLPLVPLSSFSATHDEQVKELKRRGDFSAMLLPIDDATKIILFNDHSTPGRINSDIAHEASHEMLLHPPQSTFNEDGERNYDQAIEDEANCLAQRLLITDQAAYHVVTSAMASRVACDTYGVSMAMLEFRLSASGAKIRCRRRAAAMAAE